jgi:hypothetical protein
MTSCVMIAIQLNFGGKLCQLIDAFFFIGILIVSQVRGSPPKSDRLTNLDCMLPFRDRLNY